jgi:hypothetical protein
LILFYEVALLETGSSALAWDALVYFATFPAAFFLFAGYSESLYMVLILALWLLLRRGAVHWAAFLCSLAILTRLQGAAMIIPIGWQAIANIGQASHQKPFEEIRAVIHLIIHPRRLFALQSSNLLPAFAAVLIPPFALVLYNLGLRLGGLSSVFGAYSERSSSLTWPWLAFVEFVKRIFTIQYLPSDYVDLILVVLFVALTIIGIPRLRPALSLYSLGVLVMVFSRSYSPNLLSGFMRFALTTFPIFLVMAQCRWNPRIKNGILLVFLVTQMFLTWLFINWVWVA